MFLLTTQLNNLARRLVEHYANRGKDTTFAGRYYAYNLIYCEYFQYVNQAIAREKELKGWIRLRKEELIATKNPTDSLPSIKRWS